MIHFGQSSNTRMKFRPAQGPVRGRQQRRSDLFFAVCQPATLVLTMTALRAIINIDNDICQSE